jgi:hypothetical protein
MRVIKVCCVFFRTAGADTNENHESENSNMPISYFNYNKDMTEKNKNTILNNTISAPCHI